MTTTQDIIDKLNEAIIIIPERHGKRKATEMIGEAIIMIENERMERKRREVSLREKGVQVIKSEDVIFFRRQAS